MTGKHTKATKSKSKLFLQCQSKMTEKYTKATIGFGSSSLGSKVSTAEGERLPGWNSIILHLPSYFSYSSYSIYYPPPPPTFILFILFILFLLFILFILYSLSSSTTFILFIHCAKSKSAFDCLSHRSYPELGLLYPPHFPLILIKK